MPNIHPLPSNRLRAKLAPARIAYETSDAIPRSQRRAELPPQPRARKALELALHIDDSGYNVFFSGEADLGRAYMLKEFLAPRAKKSPTPPDLVYVYNFDDPDRPRLLALPAGMGKKLRVQLAAALAKARQEIPMRFEHASYLRKRTAVQESYHTERSRLFRQMDSVAGDQGFHLDMDEQGAVTLYPMVEGKRLSEEEFEKLDAGTRKDLKIKGDKLLQAMSSLMRKLTRAEQNFTELENDLERTVVGDVLNARLTPLANRFCRQCGNLGPNGYCLEQYFADMRDDILNNIQGFLTRDIPVHPPQSQQEGPLPPEETTFRYEINLFVDNSATQGAPIITHDHPTVPNLLGCIERESELGALVTDFTLIKAGALHKANGGFLVLHMEDILSYHSAWDGLLRALRSKRARIDDTSDSQDVVKTKGIEPEPLPLKLKVILIGTEYIYDHLLNSDDRFSKLFKIKAQLEEATPRNATGIRGYLSRMAGIIDDSQLLPFDRNALAGLVDYGSRIIEDQKKLSLKFPLLREAMIEASAMAGMQGKKTVDAAVLHEALAGRAYRANLPEQYFMEEYDRDIIKVSTSGSAVGRVNGLSVVMYGDFEFGLPHQIACTVGVGNGGIIDLERESELGGPIHTKAMLILKSYMTDQFARNKPIMLTGSLCFEQSYATIEGDSASGAELAALLSAIAGVPLRLSLACTGAVSQSGDIMAVGGVTRKVEGFFELCKRQGLTGEQGVILPHDNIDHLMLNEEVCAAVDEGKFSIYPVRHISEALHLLTGMPTGRLRADNTFTPGSFFHLVNKRLAELGKLSRNFLAPRHR